MISYQMPTFMYRDERLWGSRHSRTTGSLFAFSGKVIDSHKVELRCYETSKGTISLSDR